MACGFAFATGYPLSFKMSSISSRSFSFSFSVACLSVGTVCLLTVRTVYQTSVDTKGKCVLRPLLFNELENAAKLLQEQKQLELQLKKTISLCEKKMELLRKLIKAETEEAA